MRFDLPLCFPIEIWETHIILHLDVNDIKKLLCTNSNFNEIKWKFVVSNIYPELYNGLFKNITNEHTIVDINIDYEKLFMTIHNNNELLHELTIFIQSNGKN